MTIYNLKDKLEYLDEVARLEYEEWTKNNLAIVEKDDITIINLYSNLFYILSYKK